MMNPAKRVWSWVVHVDRILRGEATRLSDLQSGSIPIPIGGVSVVLGVLGLIAGACTGCFALINGTGIPGEQFSASMVKVPMLFFLSLLITFPSLYVFNALVGSKLNVLSVLRLLTAGLAVNLSVLAALGPIVAFFSVCTDSYPFMVLLNVAVYGLSGFIGCWFLLQTLNRLCAVQEQLDCWREWASQPGSPSDQPIAAMAVDDHPGEEEPPACSVDSPADVLRDVPSAEKPAPSDTDGVSESVPFPPVGPLDSPPGQVFRGHVKMVFACWVIIFGLVGSQMAWVLRPFIGSPDTPFSWFRARESNFFEAVIRTIQALFGY